MKKGLSVIVPVYNSAAILAELVSRLEPILNQVATEYELILVNDDSRDKSWETIQTLAQQRHWIYGINLMRNYGQHNAILCGVRAAHYEFTVTMDDDLQHPPEEIPGLLDKLAEGYDVVYGTPMEEQHGLWRDLSSQITKFALQASMGINIARQVSAFRVFRTPVRAAFQQYQGSYVSIDVLLTWGTTRFTAMPVHHEPRRTGQSNYTFGKLVTHALNMITGFSIVPLQVASLMGFLFTLFGAVVFVYVIEQYVVNGGSVPGFPFLASIIILFSGTQLLVLGIIGEYLARVYSRTMNYPGYAIQALTTKIIYDNMAELNDKNE